MAKHKRYGHEAGSERSVERKHDPMNKKRV